MKKIRNILRNILFIITKKNKKKLQEENISCEDITKFAIFNSEIHYSQLRKKKLLEKMFRVCICACECDRERGVWDIKKIKRDNQ